MTILSSTFSVDDKSKRGCKSRRVLCTGRARASDAKKSKALREAAAEAERQRKLAVTEAETSIICPPSGCSGDSDCRQVGSWKTGRQIGRSADARKVGTVWEAKASNHIERRLKCRCRKPATVVTQTLRRDTFLPEKTALGVRQPTDPSLVRRTF